MASLVQSVVTAKALLICSGLLPEAYSAPVGFLMILVLFIVFLLPFDRRIIERYIWRVGAAPARPVASTGNIRSGKEMLEPFGATPMDAGPYTRQLCKMLDLEVVSFSRRKFFFGCWLVELAIGRWNDKAREFEIVTEWCETWEGLEEEARQAMKSFREVADPRYRGASNV